MKVGGVRWRLVDIARMSKAARREVFSTHRVRMVVVRAFVARKLRTLVKGLTFSGVAAGRVRRSEFAAVKKREMRFIRGEFSTKRSKVRSSRFVRHKLGVHLILSGKGVPLEGRLPDWGAKRDIGLLSPTDIRRLLRPLIRWADLTDRARQLLRTECQTSATCSRNLLF